MLELLLNGAKHAAKPVVWADQRLKAEYTRIGQKLPKNVFYAMMAATPAVLAPTIGSGLGHYLNDTQFAVALATIPPLVFGISYGGYKMREKEEITAQGEAALNPRLRFLGYFNKGLRLPTFATGIGFLAKSASDLASLVMSNAPTGEGAAYAALAGTGFLWGASVMYLGDQDPKLLDKDKSPSKLKALLSAIRQRANGVLNPVPPPKQLPQPELAVGYSPGIIRV